MLVARADAKLPALAATSGARDALQRLLGQQRRGGDVSGAARSALLQARLALDAGDTGCLPGRQIRPRRRASLCAPGAWHTRCAIAPVSSVSCADLRARARAGVACATGSASFASYTPSSQLQDVRGSGSRRDNPTLGLANGLLAGFLTEQAEQAIPVTLPRVGTVALSSLLPGGTGNCTAHSDKEVHNGVSGWWFYLNFTADEVPYVDLGD